MTDVSTRTDVPIYTKETNNLRVAFMHDNYVQHGGAERVAEEIARILPDSDLFTSVFVDKSLTPYMRQRGIRSTWMQKLPNVRKYYRHYFLLYPFAVRTLSFKGYRLIVSSCIGFGKMIIKPKDAVHICYCHTPTRWIWRFDDYVGRENFNSGLKSALSAIMKVFKRFDRKAADGVDVFIANSTVVKQRIKDFYGRDARVIFPPIDASRFYVSDTVDDYYLIVSRLIGYKRVDLAIQACKKLGKKLMIAGSGADKARLEALAGPETTFLGRISDAEVAERLSRCKAFIFPGEEDFGLTPLEANASGRPCIAYGQGGSLDTVREGVTGVLFREPTSDSLADAILRLESTQWDPRAMRAHAESFDVHVFARKMVDLLEEVGSSHGTPRRAAPAMAEGAVVSA